MASTSATGGTDGGKDNGGGGKDESGRGKRVEKREYRRGKHHKLYNVSEKEKIIKFTLFKVSYSLYIMSYYLYLLFIGLFCTCVLICEGKIFYFSSKDGILGVKRGTFAMTKDLLRHFLGHLYGIKNSCLAKFAFWR
ncbi:hypothetical protein E2C01_062832 [Portunus trituberculatus]|uniref:Uncharacterized protein n=1 Tax=Portunus trituberculatus TaxID=210409 RepID=A0A5B7H8Z3_PORTR|nr:hypothetical protein [Portunus trituberculatus]